MSPPRERPSLTVVIPALNEERYLPPLLGDLARQSLRPDEVVVVNAGSRDRTRDVARAAGARVLEGGGLPGPSRNLGAAHARTGWLLFLDADVRLPAHAIADAWRQVHAGRLAGASCGFTPDRGGVALRAQHRLSLEYFWATSRIGWPHAIGAFLLVRRSAHEAIGGFDPSVLVAEDQDYVRRLARHGAYRFLRHPQIQIAVRRFEREGVWRQGFAWVRIELHRLVRGEVRRDDFRYFASPGTDREPERG